MNLELSGFVISWSAAPGIPGCGGHLTNAAGTFRSPAHPESYDDNLNCEWVIRVPPNDRIKLTFHQFELEHEQDCEFDYLEVREGGRADGPLVGRFCGTQMPPEYLSNSNQLFVRFALK